MGSLDEFDGIQRRLLEASLEHSGENIKNVPGRKTDQKDAELRG